MSISLHVYICLCIHIHIYICLCRNIKYRQGQENIEMPDQDLLRIGMTMGSKATSKACACSGRPSLRGA